MPVAPSAAMSAARLAVQSIAAADGDEWDRLSDAYDADWKAAYEKAFVEHALSRPGWDRENAEVWASEIVGDALTAYRGTDTTPDDAARVDILECEREACVEAYLETTANDRT